MANAHFKDAKRIEYLLSCRVTDSKEMLEASCNRFYETTGATLLRVVKLFPEIK